MPVANVLDLSHHNDPHLPNFAALKQRGVLAVILKATQGHNYTDPTFADRVRSANDAGMPVGAYHFMNAADAGAQADYFLGVTGRANIDQLMRAADYENNASNLGGTPALHQLMDFMGAVDQGANVSTVIYSSNLIRETLTPHIGGAQNANMIGAGDFFRKHRLWLAEYGPHENIPWPWNAAIRDKDNAVVSPAPGAWLWQFQDRTNQFAGILSGQVDCNFYDGTAEQLAAHWIS